MHYRIKKGLPLGVNSIGVIKGWFRKQLQSFFLMCIRTIDIVFLCVSWFDYSFFSFNYGVSCWLLNIHLFLSSHLLLLDDAARFELFSSFFTFLFSGT